MLWQRTCEPPKLATDCYSLEAVMPHFTIADAARAVGVDRATLYRYIKSGKLSVTRDEKGKRGIDATELSRVFPEVSQSVASVTAERVDLLQEKLRAAEEKCTLLQQQLSAATAREEWMQQQIIGLQQRLLPSPRQGIIERIAEAIARLRRPKGTS
jgi:AcrR family transcriptional regulator